MSVCQIRRRCIGLLSLAAAVLVFPLLQNPASAQSTFPSKPLHFIVPFPPGGISDVIARTVAEALSQRLGQQVVVENKAGAAGNIAMTYVAQANPDGYTFMLAENGTMTINPFIFDNLAVDTMKDLVAIGRIGDYSNVIYVNPDAKIGSLGDLIAQGKKPEGLKFGTAGVGSIPHLVGVLLAQRTGANLIPIHYKGGGPALTDAIGGHIPVALSSVAGGSGHVKAGRLKAIAITSAERLPALPDLPTAGESVPGFSFVTWVGLVGPSKMPKSVIDRLNTELNAVLASPELRSKFETAGIRATPSSPESFRDEMASDLERNKPVIKSAGIRVEQ